MGDWGNLILQIGVTIGVILVLTAGVYWLVRRYSTFGLGGIGRGRVPRLAVVDALTVDRRRRLLLVRRDNVEHLILIGGPSDLVVEQTIQRLRSRQRQASVAPAAQPETPIIQELTQSGLGLEPQSLGVGIMPPLSPAPETLPTVADNTDLAPVAPRVPPSPPSRPERRQANVAEGRPPQSIEPRTAPTSPQLFEPVAAVPPASVYQPAPLPGARELRVVSSDISRHFEPDSRPAAANESSEPALTKIGDLEQEMARLLGQLNVKRPS